MKLADVSWLQGGTVQHIFSMFAGAGAEIRVVGGAVRNAILNETVSDIDFATTATPKEILRIAKVNKVRVKPTAVEYGTVLLLFGEDNFEVTTLREDVKTFGRRAKVEFGRNWARDSRRRDFTMNALYADRNGKVYDYVGGLEDCKNRKLKFIGNAEQRIKEDFLRILRYFRFLSKYANHMPDEHTLDAISRNKYGLNRLSRERVRSELLKLLETINASSVVKCMDENGLLEILLGGKSHPERLNNLSALTNDPLLRLLVLSVGSVEDVNRIAEKLGLSKKERKRIRATFDSAEAWKSNFEDQDVYCYLYQYGRHVAIDGATVAWSRECATENSDKWQSIAKKLESFEIPKFPVSGKDLVSAGLKPGESIGAKLKIGRETWIKSGFSLKRDEIVKQLVA